MSGSHAGDEPQAEPSAADPAGESLAVAPVPARQAHDVGVQVDESLESGQVPAEGPLGGGTSDVVEESPAVVPAEESAGSGLDVVERPLVVAYDSLAAPLEDAPVSVSPEQARLAEARRRVEELPADGSIRVVFQPIVDLATTKVIGYEALARFPGDTTVSPRTWFAEAAEVGLLLEIEMTAIRAALAHLERLPRDAFISVNVSPATAGSDELRNVLGEVDPKRVVLEITENAAAGDFEEVSEAVGALRATGVRVALDDTGSGSVSFNSLFDVHADIIKIDIDVTHGIESDPMKEAMASALKGLADRLGAMSLAEGIETEEELNLLRDVGVQAGQGYLFGRPEPVGE